MSNMSYCRFQNTLSDLRDCYDNMNDTDDLSLEEIKAYNRLVKLCKEIAEDYGDDELDETEEDDDE